MFNPITTLILKSVIGFNNVLISCFVYHSYQEQQQTRTDTTSTFVVLHRFPPRNRDTSAEKTTQRNGGREEFIGVAIG